MEAEKDKYGCVVIPSENLKKFLWYINYILYKQDKIKDDDPLLKPTMERLRASLKHLWEVLDRKILFETSHDGLILTKRWKNQQELIEWLDYDVELINKIITPIEGGSSVDRDFSDLEGCLCIERSPLGPEHLTISEYGVKNRIWAQDEIDKIASFFNEEEE